MYNAFVKGAEYAGIKAYVNYYRYSWSRRDFNLSVTQQIAIDAEKFVQEANRIAGYSVDIDPLLVILTPLLVSVN
jgi:hypothetical protein